MFEEQIAKLNGATKEAPHKTTGTENGLGYPKQAILLRKFNRYLV